jgi:hypothetical protein
VRSGNCCGKDERCTLQALLDLVRNFSAEMGHDFRFVGLLGELGTEKFFNERCNVRGTEATWKMRLRRPKGGEQNAYRSVGP